ncbi:hypothetical protein CONCODRAFT_14301 [Conidiobolus coronatus NRRL 28638]|uniref:Uncharacterized protein n=1 Tax=Conidiobolus coronatus (strain ATCC 28846 / CBS 209.66 / NRRL 28638) TaxID=796925 RepID=A0A137NP90_CONC2|nr:hypothetical protein CONCODRAFT_14301 [Conidiobolus coronatus NRRL 28638]|eukprot:KXN64556.1 hypothetical protein CONCODRAFT_14301 [Conidiobolus coronatus NRRL 28638]
MNLIILGALISASLALPTIQENNNNNQLGLSRRGNVNLFGDRGGDVETMDDHFAMTVHGNSNHSGRDITDTEITNTITGAASDILMRRHNILSGIANGKQFASGIGVSNAASMVIGDTINNFQTVATK